MTPAELKSRGENAARILGDRLMAESFDLLEKEIIESWEKCPVRDAEGREELWRLYKTAKKFKGIFEGIIQSGQVVNLREIQKDPNSGAPKFFSRR